MLSTVMCFGGLGLFVLTFVSRYRQGLRMNLGHLV